MTMKYWLSLLAVLGLIALGGPSGAQQTTPVTVLVGGSPVSASNPLPTNATTTPTGTQNVTGTGSAGTAATGVVTVQGIASMTPLLVTATQSSTGITPVVSTAAESNRVLKASGGVLWGLTVGTGASAGYVMIFNATSAPGDGAVTPIECLPVAANSSVSISFAGGPPAAYSTGITAVFSTTGCFTKAASATAFFSGKTQ